MNKTKKNETVKGTEQTQPSKDEVVIIRVNSRLRAGLALTDPSC